MEIAPSGAMVSFPTAFIVSAVFCAIGGLLSASRLRSGIPTLGDGYEEDAIAAAVIGGASMSGGEGYIGGTVVGSLLIATIKNAGTLLGFDTNVTKGTKYTYTIRCMDDSGKHISWYYRDGFSITYN